MVIYGVASLALCTLIGLFAGDRLGAVLGLKANVGGVGFAMLALIILTHMNRKRFAANTESARGIGFWSMMYIPIIVAMAANQNVLAAAHGGPVAIIAGLLAVATCFSTVPLLTRLARRKEG